MNDQPEPAHTIVSEHLGTLGPTPLDTYLAHGGYQGLTRALLSGPGATIDTVAASGLTGRSGGSAFPTAGTFRTLPPDPEPYLVVNGDESEPGLVKGRAPVPPARRRRAGRGDGREALPDGHDLPPGPVGDVSGRVDA